MGSKRPKTISFADVALQTLSFDESDEAASLVLELLDTKWMQRLRRVKQTGNTSLVYMFTEHSRFGHSLGVSYLALSLMNSLSRFAPDQVAEYRTAVAVAALLHDIGHVAPGSHLGARAWAPQLPDLHEEISARIIENDEEIRGILDNHDPELTAVVARILREDTTLPPWTVAILSGGGWNVDRGSWTIIDSMMAAVSYGQYNVRALAEAYRLLPDGRLAINESRLDALTHFFVARDSMYRQVYQHRVLQAADALTINTVKRVRDLFSAKSEVADLFLDSTMKAVLSTPDYARELSLKELFQMTESWWLYHVERWCSCGDPVLRDLSSRLRDRNLFKTIRLDQEESKEGLIEQIDSLLESEGLQPEYYRAIVDSTDKHRRGEERSPLVILDNGEIREVIESEPLIAALVKPPETPRRWVVVPKQIKQQLGRKR